MKPTDILKSEHRVIEQVLNCLEKITEACSRDGKLDDESALNAIAFFKTFADKCHHGKEEDQLFPLAVSRGIAREQGPIGQMESEHEMGRTAIAGMETALPDAAKGEPVAIAEFVEYAHYYIRLLRDHIQKEDHCLFPMVDRVMSDEDQAQLMGSFQKSEEEDMGKGTHEKYLQIANDLADRYGVTKVEMRPELVCGHSNTNSCHH